MADNTVALSVGGVTRVCGKLIDTILDAATADPLLASMLKETVEPGSNPVICTEVADWPTVACNTVDDPTIWNTW